MTIYHVPARDGTSLPDGLTPASGREMMAYEFLMKLGIPFDVAEHREEPGMSMEALEATSRALGVRICKNLFLSNRQQTSFTLLLMPPDKPFRTSELSKMLGVSRMSFGGPDALERLLGLYPGSVSVLGLMNDREHAVRLVIDRDVLNEEWFGCHPCDNTASVRFRTEYLTDRILPALGITPTVVRLGENGDNDSEGER